MTKHLTPVETQTAIRRLGIEKPVHGSTFGIFDHARSVRYDFHRHTRHQFLFPVEGVLFVETKSAFYVCSAQMGLWIPAGIYHATTSGACPVVSVFFDRDDFVGLSDAPAMVRISVLLREATTHIIERKVVRGSVPADTGSDSYAPHLFQVVHALIRDNRLESSWPTLPVGQSDMMKKTISVAMRDLSSCNIKDLARDTGQSERSMRRRFHAELGIGPELFIQRARLIRAMQLLVGNKPLSITEIALEVGYSNHSAFSSAFRTLTGQTPTRFRKLG